MNNSFQDKLNLVLQTEFVRREKFVSLSQCLLVLCPKASYLASVSPNVKLNNGIFPLCSLGHYDELIM